MTFVSDDIALFGGKQMLEVGPRLRHGCCKVENWVISVLVLERIIAAASDIAVWECYLHTYTTRTTTSCVYLMNTLL